MLQIQLYIEGQEIELHENESIVLTQSLQDVLDIQKVFTDYTRTFNVPASKTNNKVFKHFHNPAIQSTQNLISREAEITLNYSPFKKGKIKLESVEVANGTPLNYRITFFGNTIEFKELIGNSMLSDLVGLNFGITYDASQVLSLMQDGQNIDIQAENIQDALIYPIISNEERFVYDQSDSTSGTRNLYASGNQHGLVFSDLKPAIRLHAIILAIERTFNIKFSRDFFNNTNYDYYNLYLWLHKQKGGVKPEEDNEDNFTYLSGSWDVRSFSNETMRQIFSSGNGLNNRTTSPRRRRVVISAAAGSGVDYSVRLFSLGNNIFEQEFTGNAQVISLDDDFELPQKKVAGLNQYTGYTYISVSADPNASIDFTVTVYDGDSSATATQTYTTGSSYTTSILDEMPSIKVMDFLMGVFKMFNLTAYYTGDEIKVLPLDEYYASSTTTYDITKYVDKTKSEVGLKYPYSLVDFTYKGMGSFFTKFHSTFFGLNWGWANYNDTSDYSSEEYKIELPFEHHKFEKFPSTTVQWGWSVDEKQEKYLGKPFLFYAHKVENGTAIQFTETVGGVMHEINDYYIPSNSIDPTDNTQSIHFGVEKNEYTNQNSSESLFKTYYQSYIEEVFNDARRIFKYKAFLPLSILSNIQLNDRVILFNELYKINKLTTNFETNISELELINEVQDFNYTIEQTITETVQTVDAAIAKADSTLVTADVTTYRW